MGFTFVVAPGSNARGLELGAHLLTPTSPPNAPSGESSIVDWGGADGRGGAVMVYKGMLKRGRKEQGDLSSGSGNNLGK